MQYKFDDFDNTEFTVEEEVFEGIHIADLVPTEPKKKFNAIYSEVVMRLAKEDPHILHLAQQLSDEVDGVGIVNALKILSECGMIINYYLGQMENNSQM